MATEKFINGKHDDAHHDGRYSNVKREQAANQHFEDFLSGVLDLDEQDGIIYQSSLSRAAKTPLCRRGEVGFDSPRER